MMLFSQAMLFILVSKGSHIYCWWSLLESKEGGFLFQVDQKSTNLCAYLLVLAQQMKIFNIHAVRYSI